MFGLPAEAALCRNVAVAWVPVEPFHKDIFLIQIYLYEISPAVEHSAGVILNILLYE